MMYRWSVSYLLIALLAMGTFFTTFVVASAAALLIATPLIIVARQRNRDETIRRILVSGGVVALMAAVIAASSKRLVDQCLDAGNLDCIDYGSSGMQIVLFFGFAVVALGRALVLYRR